MSPAEGEEKPAPVVCAGAVVRDDAGRVLLVQRGREPSRGLWSVPGGRVEVGESPAQAAAREVLEETGLVIEVGRLLETVEIGEFLVHDFAGTVVGGTLCAGDDADDVRWCALEDAPLLPLTPGLYDALRRMLASP